MKDGGEEVESNKYTGGGASGSDFDERGSKVQREPLNRGSRAETQLETAFREPQEKRAAEQTEDNEHEPETAFRESP